MQPIENKAFSYFLRCACPRDADLQTHIRKKSRWQRTEGSDRRWTEERGAPRNRGSGHHTLVGYGGGRGDCNRATLTLSAAEGNPERGPFFWRGSNVSIGFRADGLRIKLGVPRSRPDEPGGAQLSSLHPDIDCEPVPGLSGHL